MQSREIFEMSRLTGTQQRWKKIMLCLLISAQRGAEGRDCGVLVVVGALNGLILPIVLGSLLLAAKKEKIVGAYRHSSFLFYTGWLVFAVMLYMSLQTILKMLG